MYSKLCVDFCCPTVRDMQKKSIFVKIFESIKWAFGFDPVIVEFSLSKMNQVEKKEKLSGE